MADPVINGVYRSMVVLQGASALPEDRFITTWCFRATGGAPEDVADAAADALTEFYNTIVGSDGNVCTYIGPQASRAVDASKVITYHLGDAIPRVPMERPFTLGSGSGSAPFPAEVACVLSFHTAATGPSSMGRVYIGPLVSIAGSLGTFSDSRPVLTFRNILAGAAGRLRTNALAGTPSLEWSVLSQKLGTATPVTGGWIDDAWDTQRRRGLDPTGRTLWPIP